MLIVELLQGGEGKKHTSPRMSQSKCRLCGQRITDKFRLHRGRKFCSQVCLRKYSSNSMEQAVPYSAESQTQRKSAVEELNLSTELTRNEQRNALQDAYQSLPEMVKVFHILTVHYDLCLFSLIFIAERAVFSD